MEKNLRARKGYLMASERPIRRKPCSHANNFESLIAFRKTYVWGGGGDGGRRGWGRFQWFSGCNMLTVIFFSLFFPSRLSYFSLSVSLSPQPRKKKKKKKKKKKPACTRTPKSLCIFLRNARPRLIFSKSPGVRYDRLKKNVVREWG